MTSKQAFRGGLTALAGILLCTVSISVAAAQQSKLRIVQTNSAGDNVHIIDAATNKVVGEVKGIEAPHGVATAPDGSKIYFSEQATNTVTVVDGKTLQVIKRIPLSGNPNLIDLTPDGRSLYVAQQGSEDIAIVDLQTRETTVLSCACRPTVFSPLRGDSVFRLNGLSNGPISVLDASSSSPRTLFIPVDPNVLAEHREQ